LTGSVCSAGLAKQMVWLSGLLAFEQAAQVCERIGGGFVPAPSIWRQTQAHGERLRVQPKRAQGQVGVERVVLPPPGQDHRRPKGISLNGGMVNVRGEGWKEIKVGAVFDVEERRQRDPLTHEWGTQARGANVAYTAVLGSPEAFGPALWALAVEGEVPQAAKSSVTADGAEWIWNLAADYFPDSEQVVDWCHACEHLGQAASALHPDDAEHSERWFKSRRENLYLGEIQTITGPLDEADLGEHSRYFHIHQRRMRYQ
jgi:hypothetical protein